MHTTKSYLAAKSIKFPNRTMLIEKRNSLQLNIKSELDNEGVSVNYSELVKMTTTSLINVIETTECNENINQLLNVNVTFKNGGDTAGSQTVWKSAAMTNASDHLFQYSVVPLFVEQGSKLLWKNPSPNSATSCRPVLLL